MSKEYTMVVKGYLDGIRKMQLHDKSYRYYGYFLVCKYSIYVTNLIEQDITDIIQVMKGAGILSKEIETDYIYDLLHESERKGHPKPMQLEIEKDRDKIIPSSIVEAFSDITLQS